MALARVGPVAEARVIGMPAARVTAPTRIATAAWVTATRVTATRTTAAARTAAAGITAAGLTATA
jgi:hypothetical protein